MSRPSLYERLGRVQRILGVNLGDPKSCLSLQVALQAWAAIAERSTPSPV